MSNRWISATVHLLNGTTVSLPTENHAAEIAQALATGRTTIDLTFTKEYAAGLQRVSLTVPSTAVAYLDQRWAP